MEASRAGEGPGRRARRTAEPLCYLGAALTLFVGAVHLQQYVDFISEVPTIGVLFLLNAGAAGVVAAMLATPLRVPAALLGIAISLGALIAILVAMTSTLFGYSEPDLRLPVAVAVAAEAAAVAVLGAYLAASGAARGD